MANLLFAEALGDFAAYGEIIRGEKATNINNGYARKHSSVAAIDAAPAQLNLFDGISRISPIPLTMMERHPFGSQAFYPLAQKPWLAAVANGDSNIGTVCAYQISGDVGLNYRRGVWHHPLLAVAAQKFIVADKAGDDNLEERYFADNEVRWLFFDEALMHPESDKPLAKNPADMDESEYLAAFGGIFEHSAWVAKTLWCERTQANTVIRLHQAMAKIVLAAKPALQQDLIAAHPQLAAAKLETLGAFSQNEQQQAGLNALTATDKNTFEELNAAYHKKFNFPFIVSVAGQNKDDILSAMHRRINNTATVESNEALYQVFKIARARLSKLLTSGV